MNNELKNERVLNDEEMNSKELNDEELSHVAGGRGRRILFLTCPKCGGSIQAHIGDRSRTCNSCGYVMDLS